MRAKTTTVTDARETLWAEAIAAVKAATTKAWKEGAGDGSNYDYTVYVVIFNDGEVATRYHTGNFYYDCGALNLWCMALYNAQCDLTNPEETPLYDADTGRLTHEGKEALGEVIAMVDFDKREEFNEWYDETIA
jgi:hypothetical protein